MDLPEAGNAGRRYLRVSAPWSVPYTQHAKVLAGEVGLAFPAKLALQLRLTQQQNGWSAMRTGAGKGTAFKLLQELAHFFMRQRLTCPHGRMASDCGQHLLAPIIRRCATGVVQMVCQLIQSCGDLPFA